MKVLVTGTAGFLASNITDYLLANNHTVVGIDNFNNYYSPKIKEYNILEFKDNPKFKLYRSDILDTKSLANIFEQEKPNAIVHMAAWAGVTKSIEEPVEYVRNNIEGTVNLAELAVKHDISSFIFASTSSVYGDNTTPFIETMSTDHPLAPYPASKKACEVMLSTYSRNFSLNINIMRIFNPIGKRLRPDLALTQLIKSCLYGNEFKQYQDSDSTGRDYTYVAHLCEAISYMLEHPFKYEIFNIGNSYPIKLGELISVVEKIVGKKATITRAPQRMGEMQITYANIEKARSMINYNPSTLFETSVKNYYDWFLQQEEWYKKGEY